MEASLTFYKAKMHLYSSKFNFPKDLIKISHRQIFSINSDKAKNVTTRSISKDQSSQEDQEKMRISQTVFLKDSTEKIHIKSEDENRRRNSTKIQPKRHKSFSTYVTRMINNRKPQKELKVSKSLSKNIKEMKVQKCNTQVVFHKNLTLNYKQKITKPYLPQKRKTQNYPDFKGSLIVLGMKQRKMAQLKAEQQKMMKQTMNLPHIISAWNSKSSPPKKFNTVIMEKAYKDSWPHESTETQSQDDEALFNFLRSLKMNFTKRSSFMMKKLSKSLIN